MREVEGKGRKHPDKSNEAQNHASHVKRAQYVPATDSGFCGGRDDAEQRWGVEREGLCLTEL